MLSRIKQAREKIQVLRLALQSPSAEDIGAALTALQEAVSSLEAIGKQVRGGVPASYDVRREVQMLKNDLKISRRLIERGIAFCRGWARLAGAGPEYTQTGKTAVLVESRGTLSLQG